MMNEIFNKLISERRIIVYMDDILIFATTREELEPNDERGPSNTGRQ